MHAILCTWSTWMLLQSPKGAFKPLLPPIPICTKPTPPLGPRSEPFSGIWGCPPDLDIFGVLCFIHIHMTPTLRKYSLVPHVHIHDAFPACTGINLVPAPPVASSKPPGKARPLRVLARSSPDSGARTLTAS